MAQPTLTSYIKYVPSRGGAGSKIQTWNLSDGSVLTLKTTVNGGTSRVATLTAPDGGVRSITVKSLRAQVQAAAAATPNHRH